MPTNIGDSLRHAVEHLQSHGREDAGLEARLLLAHVLGVAPSYLFSHAQTTLGHHQNKLFQQLLARRIGGEPLAYITGECGFWTLDLKINRAVLIPRPDTETLVQSTLDTLPSTPCRIVDLGTGSGAIALALASERKQWDITATDASEAALECAQANAERLSLQRVRFVHGRWFEPLAGQHFDAVVSNPPYIAPGDAHLQAPELGFEPGTALVAQDNGLADLAWLARHAPSHLNSQGWLLLEHGYDQGAAVRQLLRQAGFGSVHTQNDLAGRERVTLGQVAMKKPD